MVPSGPLKTSAPKVSFVTQRYLVHIPQQKPLIQGGDTPHGKRSRVTEAGAAVRPALAISSVICKIHRPAEASACLQPHHARADGDEDRIHHKTAARGQNQNRKDEEP